jgi:hypothetical protein
MTYLKVEWLHNFEDEPIELLSELDGERYETRKVERFRNGFLGFAGPDGASGSTMLGEKATPPLAEIAADPEFRVASISKDVFERAWPTALIASAA